MALSADGLHWEPPATLYDAAPGETIGYPTLLGASSARTDQDCLLVYAKEPATGLARKDMVERWVHFGRLAPPAKPLGLRASGRVAYEAAVTLTWRGVPAADAYDVGRRLGRGGWSPLGTVRSSGALPSFVDRTIALGKTASYRIVARNAAGVGPPSEVVSGGPVTRDFRIRNEGSGLFLEAGPDGRATLQKDAANEARQRWRFTTQDGGGYRIVNQASGLALDGSKVPSGLVGLVPSLGGGRPGGRWVIRPAGPTLGLFDAASGLCLDGFGGGTSPGTPIDVYPFRGASNQRWRIVG